MSKSEQKEILVIAHDAGGAEIIAAYIMAHPEKRFACYAAGPAVKVFKRQHVPAKTITVTKQAVETVVKKHHDAAFALLGTGWMTKVEVWALEAAKAKGVPTVCYLESWVNYRERFGYPNKNWKNCLPNEIWVGDDYALALAARIFPSSQRIRHVPNQYFKQIKARAKEIRRTMSRGKGILFLSDAVPGVERSLEKLLQYVAKVQPEETVSVSFHPADPPDRYDAVIERYKDTVSVKKSKEKDIVRNLLSARVVVGAETVALVVSVLIGKPTVCIVPTKRQRRLPHPEILYVTNMKEAANLI